MAEHPAPDLHQRIISAVLSELDASVAPHVTDPWAASALRTAKASLTLLADRLAARADLPRADEVVARRLAEVDAVLGGAVPERDPGADLLAWWEDVIATCYALPPGPDRDTALALVAAVRKDLVAGHARSWDRAGRLPLI